MALIDMTAQQPAVQEHVRDYRKEHPKSTDYKALTRHLIKRIPAASTAIASLGYLSLLGQQEELQRRLAAAEQAEQHYLRLASELQSQSSQYQHSKHLSPTSKIIEMNAENVINIALFMVTPVHILAKSVM